MDKWLNSNTVVKIMSVGLAVLLYIAVNDSQFGISTSNQTVATIIRDVSLEPRYDHEQFIVVDMPQTVHLTLRGNSFLVNRATAGNYRAYVDLTGLGAGIHRNIPVKVEGLPEGVEYIADPANVDVELEEKQRKELDVTAEVVGQPKKGYTAGTPVVSPETVDVIAGESRITEVATVKAVININGATETVAEDIPLKAYNEHGEVMEDVEITVETAEVEVPIYSPSVDIPIQPQVDVLPPIEFAVASVTVDEEIVTVYGDGDVIQNLDAYPGPSLDLSDVMQDRTFVLPIPLIDGVEKVEPETVRIDVNIVQAERETFEKLPLEVRGKPEGWDVRFLDEEGDIVSVDLIGARERLNRVNRQDIRPYIDVSNLPVGSHQVEIEWDLPAYIRLQTDDKRVRIQLIER